MAQFDAKKFAEVGKAAGGDKKGKKEEKKPKEEKKSKEKKKEEPAEPAEEEPKPIKQKDPFEGYPKVIRPYVKIYICTYDDFLVRMKL